MDLVNLASLVLTKMSGLAKPPSANLFQTEEEVLKKAQVPYLGFPTLLPGQLVSLQNWCVYLDQAIHSLVGGGPSIQGCPGPV